MLSTDKFNFNQLGIFICFYILPGLTSWGLKWQILRGSGPKLKILRKRMVSVVCTATVLWCNLLGTVSKEGTYDYTVF